MKKLGVPSLWRRLVWAVVFGVLLALFAVYRLSPIFTPNDELMAAWADTKKQTLKDQYILFSFLRMHQGGVDEKTAYLLPIVTPAFVRLGRLDEFDQLLTTVPDEFRKSTSFLQGMVVCIEELLKVHELARAQALLKKLRSNWEDSLMAQTLLDRVEILINLAKLYEAANQIVQAIDGQNLPIDDPQYIELEKILNTKIDLPTLLREDAESKFNRFRAYPYLYFGRVLSETDGLLDRFGDEIINYANETEDYGTVVSGMSHALLIMQKKPQRWAEWRRWVERIENTAFPGLLCVRDYSLGYLLAVQDQNYQQAETRLVEGVIKRKDCRGPIADNAENVLKIIRSDPTKLYVPEEEVDAGVSAGVGESSGGGS